MLDVGAVSWARSRVIDAADYVRRRNPYGAAGLELAARHACAGAELLALYAHTVGPGRSACDLLDRAHQSCIALAMTGDYAHAADAIESAWHAVNAAAVDAAGGPGQMGDAASDAQGTTQEIADIEQQLGPALPGGQTQLAQVVSAYTGLPQEQAAGIIGIGNAVLSGQEPSLAQLTPVIAGALALTGFGAPVVAAVVALIPLVSDILQALGIISGPESCAWRVGSVCFQGIIPAGPDSPTWQTFASFCPAGAAEQCGGFQGTATACCGAFPYYYLIDQELAVIDAVINDLMPPEYRVAAGTSSAARAGGLSEASLANASALASGAPSPPIVNPRAVSNSTDNIWLFLKTFYTLWQHNAERAINGHPSAKDAELLASTVAAWNATHGSHWQYTFLPATTPPAQRPPPSESLTYQGQVPSLIDNTYPTYVSLLLGGFLDGQQQEPVTINIGQATPVGGGSAAGGASSSSGAGVALAVAAAAVVGVGGAAAGLFGSGAQGAVKGILGSLMPGGRR